MRAARSPRPEQRPRRRERKPLGSDTHHQSSLTDLVVTVQTAAGTTPPVRKQSGDVSMSCVRARNILS